MKWLVAMLLSFVLCYSLCSCDGHNEVIDNGLVGHVLCTDGHVRTYDAMVKSRTEPIAVVFYGNVNLGEDTDGKTYAVYLHDLDGWAYADTLGVAQGSSADITALDGKENTYAIMGRKDVTSPMANRVFELWKFGQSAYIGSVREMRMLYANKHLVNKVLEQCGGTPLPDTTDECWYWTSTEVKGAQSGQAWLISMSSGTIQETPKTVKAKIRPIVTVHNK